MKTFIGILIFTAIVIGLIVVFKPSFTTTPTPTTFTSEEPTNFVQQGILVFPNKTDTGQDKIHFSYRSSPSAPDTIVELPISADTMCVTLTGSLPCMAMSVQFSTAFEGKTAVVEGIEKEAKLQVKVIRVIDPIAPVLAPQKGIVYVVWPKAVELIESCTPAMIMQHHNLNVRIDLPDGKTVYAIEPVIDEVFKITQRVQPNCSPIPIATE